MSAQGGDCASTDKLRESNGRLVREETQGGKEEESPENGTGAKEKK